MNEKYNDVLLGVLSESIEVKLYNEFDYPTDLKYLSIDEFRPLRQELYSLEIESLK